MRSLIWYINHRDTICMRGVIHETLISQNLVRIHDVLQQFSEQCLNPGVTGNIPLKWYFHDETEALPIPQIKYQFLTYSRRRLSNTTCHSLVLTGGMVVHRVEFLISYSTQTPSFAVEKFHRKDTICPLLSTKIRYANHTPHTKLPYSASDHDNAAALVPPCCVVFLNGTPMLYRLLDSYDDTRYHKLQLYT